MTANAWVQVLVYMGVLVALAKPLGWYMARVYQGQPCGLDRVLGPIERWLYRLAGVDPQSEMSWKTYAVAMLLFNLVGLIAVYLLLRLQGVLPLNPQGFGAATPDLSFNTAVSFATNTNWQSYGGENTLSYLPQMLGLAVQNFVSAASGMAVLIALIRGLVRRSAATIGNFWGDLVRSTVYVLLPLSVVLAIVLVSQGVVQNFRRYQTVVLLQPTTDAQGKPVVEQSLPMGPAASQIAIKQLGTNGGGFFSVNSAHPYENPTPLSNFLELLAILLIPAALCYTFGLLVGDTRQGWAILAAMTIIFVVLTIGVVWSEHAGVPALATLGVDQQPGPNQAGGTMEGKETRFGVTNSALWASATTAASNGSVNAMHDSFTPLGGLVPMWLMQLGEVIYGGVLPTAGQRQLDRGGWPSRRLPFDRSADRLAALFLVATFCHRARAVQRGRLDWLEPRADQSRSARCGEEPCRSDPQGPRWPNRPCPWRSRDGLGQRPGSPYQSGGGGVSGAASGQGSRPERVPGPPVRRGPYGRPHVRAAGRTTGERPGTELGIGSCRTVRRSEIDATGRS